MPIKLESDRFNAYAKAYYSVEERMPEDMMDEEGAEGGPAAGVRTNKAVRTMSTRRSRYGKSATTPQGEASLRDKGNRVSGRPVNS